MKLYRTKLSHKQKIKIKINYQVYFVEKHKRYLNHFLGHGNSWLVRRNDKAKRRPNR